MDSRELRGFAEAYQAVYTPQEVDEAVYGGEPKKPEAPKDTRLVVTNADKKGNTPAYQNFKKGDKRYKAADHMGEEVVEEGLRSAVKRLLGGGKKEAEAPKPESRGEQLRKKYNVGPEKSDTSAKRQILDRSRAKAEKDEKDYGDKPFQKQVAQKSKAAHDRYLKAGYSKYGADDARGRGSKAAKRAAALNKEEFEFVVNALIEEGYDLSSYTWDEMYEVCLDEAVKGASRHDTEMRKAASTERKAGVKNRLSPAAGKDNADKMQRDVKFFDKLTKKNRNVVGLVAKEDFDIFDTVLEFLQVEGYAETLEEAEWLMANVIDEEAIDIILGEEQLDEVLDTPEKANEYARKNVRSMLGAFAKGVANKDISQLKTIEKRKRGAELGKRKAERKAAEEQNEEYVDEAQHARENPEKYEREQAKKSAPVRGEKTPMPPRGDKRREDFEKWYAANVR
jgi:hypothetical protein